jgi:hypothetical protein
MPDDRRQEFDLNAFWNGLVRGEPDAAGDLDPDLAETVRRLRALAQTPPPSSARARVRRGLTDQIGLHPNGKETTAMFRTATLTLPGSGFGPNGRTHPHAVPTRPTRHGVRRFSVPFATVLLLLVTLGLGYLAFWPRDPGADRPTENPAVIVPASTPATAAATASPTPFPLAGHAVIGVWALYDDPHFPDTIKAWITFDGDGRFTRVGPPDRAEIGTWRAVDAQTIEVTFLSQQLSPPQFVDLAYVPAPLETTDKYEIWTLQITVDAGGNTMTLGGGWDTYQGGDKLFSTVYYDGSRAVRMVLDPAAVTPTPVP